MIYKQYMENFPPILTVRRDEPAGRNSKKGEN